MSATKKTASVEQPAVKAGASIREHVLLNGMTVVLAERHLDPIVAVMLWYRVGARDEEEREAGVSHFLEHMMFKGSARFGKGQIDRITTVLGGSNNAFTTPDHTAYWFELASDRWEKALEIEADRMRHLMLDTSEFDSEKAVVLEELAMGEDDPWRRLTQLVQTAAFGRHPYRRPVIGYADTLKRMSADDMRAYYRRFYRPSNAILVVCGDFEPKHALALVTKHFGDMPRGDESLPPPVYRPEPIEPAGEQRVTMKWDDAASRLAIVWPSTSVGTKDDVALDVLSSVLSGGRLARLHRHLVLENALATSVSTQNDARVDRGIFWVFADLAQGVEPARLEEALDAEIERVRTELVPAKELDRAKRILLAGEAYEGETVSDLAEELGEFAADADWRLTLETTARIRKVTARDVRDVARRLLAKERRSLGWCVPKSRPKPEPDPYSGSIPKPRRTSPKRVRSAPKSARPAHGGGKA